MSLRVCKPTLCQDMLPAGECKNQDREPRPGQNTVPTSIHLVRLGGMPGWVSLQQPLENPSTRMQYGSGQVRMQYQDAIRAGTGDWQS